MNPSEKEGDTADSTPAEHKEETAASDQETERPPAQSEGDTSLKSSSKIATLQRIAAKFNGNVPDFKKQIASLSNKEKPKPECSPKKPKLAHPKQNPDSDSFDIFVRNSDCLPIPYELAADYFPPSPASTSAFVEQTIQLTDPLNRPWLIAYICFDTEEAFILTRNWAKYASTFKLQLMDTVRFVKPNPRLGPNHFMTQHFPRPDSEPVQIRFPEFLPKNFLFQMEFGQGDVRLGIERLVIDAEQVRQYFPGIRMELKQEMVKFTDYRDKDWFVKMVYTGIGHLYIVMDDVWEGFVKEHGLRAGDQVRFYKSNIISHDKHILIQFVRQNQGNGPTALGTSNRGSDNDQNKQESAAADQEIERPSAWSGGDTLLKSSSNIATLLRMAAKVKEGNVPEFLKTQIASLSNKRR